MTNGNYLRAATGSRNYTSKELDYRGGNLAGGFCREVNRMYNSRHCSKACWDNGIIVRNMVGVDVTSQGARISH